MAARHNRIDAPVSAEEYAQGRPIKAPTWQQLMVESREPFVWGWRHGYQTQVHASFAEADRWASSVGNKWSTEQIDSYLSGRDDGVKGDTTRLSPMISGKG